MEFNNQPTTHRTKTRVLLVIIMVLALCNIFFGVAYFFQRQQINNLTGQSSQQKTNQEVVAFLNLFIQKVLKTDKEVSFEDRLQLENAIRDINDPDLLAKWEMFTSGTTIDQIQASVKDLLEALVKKINY